MIGDSGPNPATESWLIPICRSRRGVVGGPEIDLQFRTGVAVDHFQGNGFDWRVVEGISLRV
jgi:hypothetical protein